ncbi:hypothetical protein ACJRO7_017548 [Eucalyptus globulus]|uniref:Uncharacterized protein n=1 Tax=Eucalyptus globulus TaxID=34317 RepID=A0ABD3KRR0_EUCGL
MAVHLRKLAALGASSSVAHLLPKTKRPEKLNLLAAFAVGKVRGVSTCSADASASRLEGGDGTSHREFLRCPNGGGTFHESACIDPTAIIEVGAVVHPKAVLGPHVHVGSGAVIGPAVTVGPSTKIGFICCLDAVYYDGCLCFPLHNGFIVARRKSTTVKLTVNLSPISKIGDSVTSQVILGTWFSIAKLRCKMGDWVRKIINLIIDISIEILEANLDDILCGKSGLGGAQLSPSLSIPSFPPSFGPFIYLTFNSCRIDLMVHFEVIKCMWLGDSECLPGECMWLGDGVWHRRKSRVGP